MVKRLRIVLCAVLPACVVGLAAPAVAPAAVNMNMKLGDFKGESQTVGHKDEIEVLAFSWGASRAGNKPPNVQDLSFTKYIDRSSPPLLDALVTGATIPDGKLTVERAGTTAGKYLRLCMTGLHVTSVSTGGSGGEDRLTENVTLTFATIVEAYDRRPATGENPPPTVFAGWDLINKLQFGDPTC